jgi:ATP-binding cassette subfamily B protein
MKTWQYLLRLILFCPWVYIGEGALRMLWVFTFLMEGLLISVFFNSVSSPGSKGFSVASVVALFLAVRTVRAALLIGGILIMVLAKYTAGTLLRKNLLQQALEEVVGGNASYSIGELVNCFRDDITGIANFLSNVLWIIVYSLAAVFAITIMVRVNLLMTIIGLLPLVAGGAIVYVARKKVERYRIASRSATGQAVGTLGSMFTIVEAVKVAGAEVQVKKHLQQLNHERGKYTIHEDLLSAILDAASSNTTAVGMGCVLLLAAYDMRAGTFTVGDFALFMYYIGWLSDLPNRIGRMIVGYKRVGISLAKMANFLQKGEPALLVKHGPIYLRGALPPSPEIEKSAADHLTTLQVTGLTYHYPGTEKGIENVHLCLPRGSFAVITGRVGAGKTTLIRTLLGLLPKDAGEIRWNGEVVAETSKVLVPPRCAYVSQVPQLFNATIRDNILLGLAKDQADIDRALSQAVLESDIANMEAGIDTLIGTRGMKLSGGQQQRLAAARMFIREAELLIFDDLSSALDVNTERIFWERLRENVMCTCLAVTRSRIALQRADWIILMKDGLVHAEGNLHELLEHNQEMRLLWQENQ